MKRRGFTIVELLIVITIMGALLILSVASLRASQISARDSERKSDTETIAVNLENYYANGSDISTTVGQYPSTALTSANVTTLPTGLLSYWNLDEITGTTATDSFGTNNGLVKINATSYYPFDGDANDASTSANNLTVTGAALTTDRFSSSNRAYSYNGTSNRMMTANTIAIDTRTNGYVISAWVYALNNTANNSWEAIVMDDNGSGQNGANFGISIMSTGVGVGAWACGNQGAVVPISIVNGWHHIAAVYTANPTGFTPVKMYVDGAYVGTSVTDRATYCATTVKLGIGNTYVGYSTFFKGSIDEVLVNKTIGLVPTDVDIAKLYSVTNAHDMNKPWVSGKNNSSYDLWGYRTDANDSPCSYIDMGTNFNSAVSGVGTQFSLAFWTYKRSGSGHAGNMQFGWYGGNYKGVWVGVGDEGQLGLTVGQGNTTGVNSNYGFNLSNGTILADQWNHIVVTYDGTNVKLYVNDVIKNTYNIGAFVDNGNGTQPLMVNKGAWDFYGCTIGKYDDIGVWSKGLSTNEVDYLYNSGAGLQYPFTNTVFTINSIKQTLRDIDAKSLTAPNVTNPSLTFIPATNNVQTISGVLPQPTISQYVYQPIQSDGTLCTLESQECRKFNLYYRLESDNTIYMLTSRNQ